MPSADLPGHGRDATTRERVTLADLATAIRTHLDRKGGSAPVLVGHALAGIGIACALERDPPPRERLILVAVLVLKHGDIGIDQIPENRPPMDVDRWTSNWQRHHLTEASI